MSVEFTYAKRENVTVLLSLAGQSGSGKTFSALRLAKGMAPAGKIAFIDTEARRALHYAGQFDFMHYDMRGPFRPERFVEAVHAAEAAGAEVIIIDSFSHCYDGIGGVLEWAEELSEQGIKPPLNWKAPKIANRKMVTSFLQARAHLIFALRADEKIEIIREGGKTQIRPLGIVPICERRFMFENVASFTLLPEKPGYPNFHLAHKLPEQLRPIFSEGRPIDESAGRALAAWAAGGVAAGPQTPSLADQGDDCARRGLEVLRTFWANLTPTEKQEVGGAAQLESWKNAASGKDAQK